MKVYELIHKYQHEGIGAFEKDTLGMYDSLKKAKDNAKFADEWEYVPCVKAWTANDTEMTDIKAYYVILEWEVQ